MHRTQPERQALARRLLGTATEPGPIDVGWLKARYGVEGSHIKRWRDHGIPAARVDELEAAIAAATGVTKEPQPEWAGAMERRLRLELERNRDLIAALAPDDIRLAAERVIERLEARLAPGGAAPDGRSRVEDQDVAELPGRGPG